MTSSTGGRGDRGSGGTAELLAEVRNVYSPQRDSTPMARRHLREVLVRTGRERWVPDAELALSEVVTNAVLHAHTEIDVRIAVAQDHVRVEVRDHNPALPVKRNYDDHATTGRGMSLVAAVAQASGVERLGDHGKLVWFCVSDASSLDEISPDDLLAAWDIEEDGDEHDEHCVEVTLRAMPVRLWLAAREHHDAILRDLAHYVTDRADLDLDLASTDRARAAISGTLASVLERDHAGGPEHHPERLDLPIKVPSDSGQMFAVMQHVLDTAEELAAAGELLVQPALPEVVAVRNWACIDIRRQLEGHDATPWAGVGDVGYETAVNVRRGQTLAWHVAEIDESTRGVAAANEANQLIAVSPALARLLGWERDELVGRRVTTLIPHRLREAHIAGFSRYLATGEAHIIGTPVDVPVLARDGTEIDASLTIERVGTGTDVVFLAWIEPRR